MIGIFGYFSSSPNHEKMLKLIKTLDYTIREAKASECSLVCNLDVSFAQNKEKSIQNEKEGYIIFCGEIFNENISDPKKYILQLYENNNLEKIKDLNGSFLAAIYDSKNEKLTIINDRFGSLKLFYCYENKDLIFSPKISPLMKLIENKKIRRDSLFDFFIFGYFLGNKTFDENIYQLLPASILEITKNGMSIKKYWSYSLDGQYDLRDKQVLIEELGTRWQKAVDIRVRNKDKIIIPISGGLDSRAILAAALKSTLKENILLYTYGEEWSYDFAIGSNIAKTLGIQHVPLHPIKENFSEQYEKSFYDVEGMIDITPYFPLQMDKPLKKFSNKIFNGYMGGEVMGPLIFSKIKNLPLQTDSQYKKAKNILLNHHKVENININTIKQLFHPSYIQDISILSSFEKSIEDLKDISSGQFPDYCAKWLYTNESDKYTFFCNFKYKSDFYYYTPFLDNDLIDFMLKVPPALRMNKQLYKQMLIRNYPELYQLPTKDMYGLTLQANHIVLFIKEVISFIKRKINALSNYIVQHNLFYNKRQNFINYDDLLRTNKEYQVFIKTMLDKVKKREFFNPEYIDTLWNLHLNGKKHYSKLFGLLVTFEILLEKYYDTS